MKRSLLLLIALLVLVFVVAACQKENGDDDSSPAPTDDDAAADDDSAADDDQADDDTTPPPQTQNYRFDLNFEVAFKALLHLRQYPDLKLEGRFIPHQRFDVINADVPLEGEGRLLQFPEAYGRMVTLKLQGPALNREPCDDQPISYSLTLAAKGDNGYMVGSLTAYCGADTYTGRPARVMRLSGLQQQED